MDRLERGPRRRRRRPPSPRRPAPPAARPTASARSSAAAGSSCSSRPGLRGAHYRELAARALALAGARAADPGRLPRRDGTSRKYVMAILEDLDRRGILRRTRTGTCRVRGRRSARSVRPMSDRRPGSHAEPGTPPASAPSSWPAAGRAGSAATSSPSRSTAAAARPGDRRRRGRSPARSSSSLAPDASADAAGRRAGRPAIRRVRGSAGRPARRARGRAARPRVIVAGGDMPAPRSRPSRLVDAPRGLADAAVGAVILEHDGGPAAAAGRPAGRRAGRRAPAGRRRRAAPASLFERLPTARHPGGGLAAARSGGATLRDIDTAADLPIPGG